MAAIGQRLEAVETLLAAGGTSLVLVREDVDRTTNTVATLGDEVRALAQPMEALIAAWESGLEPIKGNIIEGCLHERLEAVEKDIASARAALAQMSEQYVASVESVRKQMGVDRSLFTETTGALHQECDRIRSKLETLIETLLGKMDLIVGGNTVDAGVTSDSVRQCSNLSQPCKLGHQDNAPSSTPAPYLLGRIGPSASAAAIPRLTRRTRNSSDSTAVTPVAPHRAVLQTPPDSLRCPDARSSPVLAARSPGLAPRSSPRPAPRSPYQHLRPAGAPIR